MNRLQDEKSNSAAQKKPEQSTIALFGEALADVFPDRAVLGGAPYNVARHLQAFGQHPVLVTRTGNDSLRDDFLADMARLGMDDAGVQCDPNYPTGQVIVHMEKEGHRFEILAEQAYDHIHAGVTHLVTMCAHPDMVYFGTLAQRGLESRLALDIFLSDAKCARFLDINLRPPFYDKHMIRRSLLRADIVKINEEELDIVAELLHLSGPDGKSRGLRLLKQFELKCLLVTCGPDGAWLLAADGSETRAAGAKIGAGFVDTVGAGDGFAAVCMMGILQAWPEKLMLARANAFAAAICQIRGAAPEKQDFYTTFIEAWQL